MGLCGGYVTLLGSKESWGRVGLSRVGWDAACQQVVAFYSSRYHSAGDHRVYSRGRDPGDPLVSVRLLCKLHRRRPRSGGALRGVVLLCLPLLL